MKYYIDAYSLIAGYQFWRNWSEVSSLEYCVVRCGLISQQFPTTLFRVRTDGVAYTYMLGGRIEAICNPPVCPLEFHVKDAQNENVTVFVSNATEFRAWLSTKIGMATFTLQGENP